MPRKITDFLKSGLPAQIYLLCYASPQTGYSLGKKIYKIKKGIPPTSKIYPWIKKLVEKNYLEKTNDGYVAKIEPLIFEIKQIFHKNIILTKQEESILINVLKTNECKEYMEGWYNSYQRYNLVGPSQVLIGPDEPFNAIKLICETIGMLSTVFILRTEFNEIPLKEDLKKLEKQYRKQNNSEKWVQEQLKGLQQYNRVIIHFKKFSFVLLQKLAKLWPASDMIIRSEKAFYMMKYQTPEQFGWRKVK